MIADDLAADYLRRLDAAATALPAARRSELAAEVREHIDAAVADAGRSDELTMRNVLERLGPPEEIALEAARSEAPAALSGGVPSARGVTSGWGRTEVAGVTALALAWVVLAFAPRIGLWPSAILWLGLGALGAVLIALSNQWSRRRKQITLGIFAGLYVLMGAVFALTIPTSVSSTQGPGPVVTQEPVPSAVGGSPSAGP
jgi:hypothetical protein